jgi:gamma-glutamyltranspeptidase / glutathione hydrolase
MIFLVLAACTAYAGSACKAPLGGVWSAGAPTKSMCLGATTVASCCVSTPPIPADQHMDNCGGTRPIGLPFAGRSPVYAQGGMAATSQPLSTMAAIDILKAGGSAVDAAIAANALEGVVEPMMNGIGGDLMAIVYDPKTKKLKGINSSGRAPQSVSLAQMKALTAEVNQGTTIPTKGPLPVSVPGAVMGWCMLHEQYGTLPFAQVLQPAIDYATKGFPVSQVIASDWSGSLSQNDSVMTTNGKFPHAIDGFRDTFLNKEGKAPKVGEVFKNPDLARTLTLIAAGGCAAFYNGSIAEAIANFSSVGGTHLTKEDLASHYSEWADPVNSTYRDRYTVFELPPNPQGIAALQMLNILEGFNLTEMGHNNRF